MAFNGQLANGNEHARLPSGKTLVFLVRGTTLTKTLSFMQNHNLRISLYSEQLMKHILYVAATFILLAHQVKL
jgi:hypothetical protein